MESDGRVVTEITGNTLWLLPSKALYQPREQRLFVADPHFGKTDHFRKSGIPVPDGPDATNYAMLERVLEAYAVADVYFLGDLFHSYHNQGWETFAEWLQCHHQTRFHLIRGNHDVLDTAAYERAGLQVYAKPLVLGAFILSHEPLEPGQQEQLNLCGHLHPAVRLRGKGRQRLKLPCFYQTAHHLILPAFGQFTGGATVQPGEGEQVFPVGEGQVFQFEV
jgi:DNA ligase-associated metallophosphoesterase